MVLILVILSHCCNFSSSLQDSVYSRKRTWYLVLPGITQASSWGTHSFVHGLPISVMQQVRLASDHRSSIAFHSGRLSCLGTPQACILLTFDSK